MTKCVTCGNDAVENARFCPSCGTPLVSQDKAADTVRKTVTVVFADVAGSTALAESLDPESVRQVMGRYFETMRRLLERHAGTVEKFIGDAVMAVFGIPVVHEDDALRAVKAAVEMRGALAALNAELESRWGVTIAVRIGVNSGEVVAGDPSRGQAFATGDAVNLAARLEEAAAPGEILIGETTRRLVGPGVAVSEVEPLSLKGKSADVRAFRVLTVGPDPTAAPPAVRVPFVGRDAELRLLSETFERCIDERRCRLVTVLGAPGIGKSRLVAEALHRFGARTKFVVGRCPPYGEGITYLPLLDIVRQLAPSGVAELASLVASDEDARLIADRVAGAVGLAPTRGASEETQWAVGRMFEALARRGPLVVVLDDIQWAEPTFLDLVEHVLGLVRGVPLLIICLARPELVDARPSWGLGRQSGVTTVELDPLSEDESRELLERALTGSGVRGEARKRALDAAEGNPLFLEHMLALADDDAADVGVPPTIQALLSARIDRLPPTERGVIQRAAVQGRVFSRRALAELLSNEERVTLDEVLPALERRQLVRPDHGALGGDDGFRFAHALIRDAAYGFLPKEARSQLHERLARWLEQAGNGPTAALEEVVGYHLEQAYRNRADLGPVGARERALAVEAAKRLEASGQRALDRSDAPAAINLLERAAALGSNDDPARAELLPCLAAALIEAGRLSRAKDVVEDAVGTARTLRDERLEAHARLEEVSLQVQVDSEAAMRQIRRDGERSRRIFEAHGDDLGLCKLWRLRGMLHWLEGCCAPADAAWGQAAEYARLAADRRKRADIACWLVSSAFLGPVAVRFAIRRCEAIRKDIRDDRYAYGSTLRPLAALHAMAGRFAVARRLLDDSNALLEELGVTIALAASHEEAFVLMVSGEVAAAERCLRLGYERLEEMGEKAVLSSTAADLADAIYTQGRFDEANYFTEASEAAAAPNDVAAQMGWRRVRAKIVAKDGHTEEAERLASEAVALAGQTDWLSMHGDALADLGEVLQEAGRRAEAREATRQALALYEQKGNSVAADRTRARFVELTPA